MSDENESKPEIVSKTIKLAGDKDNCGHCAEGDKFFNEKSTEAGFKYQYVPMESDEGKKIADNVEANDNGNVPIPVIEYCKTIKEEPGDEPRQVCDYIEGFHKSDWDNRLNYKRENVVDDEIDEIFGND
jgi:hypothetical protein